MTRVMKRQKGFTLVEVLAAIMLIAIVLPAVMKGISVALSIAGTVRMRTEAVGLAQEKINEITTTGDWQSDSSGDFSPDHPEYQWSSNATTWDGDEEGTGIEILQVHVTWMQRGQQQEVVLSTLMRVPTSTNSQ